MSVSEALEHPRQRVLNKFIEDQAFKGSASEDGTLIKVSFTQRASKRQRVLNNL
jgi:hypothetical protein